MAGASSPIEPARPALAAPPAAAVAVLTDGARVGSSAERIVATGSRAPFPDGSAAAVHRRQQLRGHEQVVRRRRARRCRHLRARSASTCSQSRTACCRGSSPTPAPPDSGWELRPAVGDTRYRYFHLSAFADGLAVGDTVVAGQLIGYVGDTGNPGAGNYHLHFEVRPANVPVDPVPLLAIPSTCQCAPQALTCLRQMQPRASEADRTEGWWWSGQRRLVAIITMLRANGSSWRPVRRSVTAIALVSSATRSAQRM